jgi:hypothetical protein
VGWDPLYRDGNTWSVHCASGPGGVNDASGSPRLCRLDSLQVKTDARMALDRLAGVAVKSELQDWDANLKQKLGVAVGAGPTGHVH